MAKAKMKFKTKRKVSGGRSFKLTNAGDSLVGKLVDFKVKPVKGKGAEPEPTRFYFFELADTEERVFVTGKSMMDDQFDELAMHLSPDREDMEGGGAKSLLGQWFRITRGSDTTTRSENTLGTYEVELLEPDE